VRTYDHVVKLARQEIRPKDIAARLGLHQQTVYEHIRNARAKGEDLPRFSPAGVPKQKRSVQLLAEVREELEPHAAVRGLSPLELAERLLERVAHDQLVDAILDDGRSA